MIQTSADLDTATTPQLQDPELLLALLLTDFDLQFCRRCLGEDFAVHRRRSWEVLAEAQSRWGTEGLARLNARTATPMRAAAQSLIDLARYQPEALLDVLHGQLTGDPGYYPLPGEADRLLGQYRREQTTAQGYRRRAGALEDRGADREDGPEFMTLHALHEAADSALAAAADAAESLLSHLLTTGQLPTALAAVTGPGRAVTVTAGAPATPGAQRHYLVRWEIDAFADSPREAAAAARAAMTRPGTSATVFDVYAADGEHATPAVRVDLELSCWSVLGLYDTDSDEFLPAGVVAGRVDVADVDSGGRYQRMAHEVWATSAEDAEQIATRLAEAPDGEPDDGQPGGRR